MPFQLHQKTESYTKLRAMIKDIVDNQTHEALTSQQEKGPVKDISIPVVPSTNGDEKGRKFPGVDNGECSRGEKNGNWKRR